MTLIKTPGSIVEPFAAKFDRPRIIHKNSLFYQKYYYKVCYELAHVTRLFLSDSSYYDQYQRGSGTMTKAQYRQVCERQDAVKPILAQLIQDKRVRTIINIRSRFSLFANDLTVFDQLNELDRFLVRKPGARGPTVIGSVCPTGTIRLSTSDYKFRCYLARSNTPCSTIDALATHSDKVALSGTLLHRTNWTQKHTGSKDVVIFKSDYFDTRDSESITLAMLMGVDVSKVVNIVKA